VDDGLSVATLDGEGEGSGRLAR